MTHDKKELESNDNYITSGDSFSQNQSIKKYTTISTAGNISHPPTNYAIITDPKYQYAFCFYQSRQAYLQPCNPNENVTLGDFGLCLNGFPVSADEIKSIYTNDIPTMNLTLLKVFFNIMLYEYSCNPIKNRASPQVIRIYLPELFRYIGKKTVSRNEVLSIINEMLRFHQLVGIIDGDILPVMLYMGEEQSTNTLSFSSPYIYRVIEKLSAVSIQKETSGTQRTIKTAPTNKKPVYSYLISPSIYNERNFRAVEIVHIIVALIEQAGNNSPSIKAKTIVERVTSLQDAINKAKPADRNKLLKRTFSKAFELLRTHTDLEKVYTNIQLPDPMDKKNIPTMSKLESTKYIFTHQGKNKKKP